MESGSDWDSLSGGEDFEPESVSIAVGSSQKLQQNREPMPPPSQRSLSPVNKSPLSRTNGESRPPPRVAENYRNMMNRGNVHGITQFKDTGSFDDVSERSTVSRSRKDVPITEDAFQSIEMKEKIAAQNRIHKSSTGSKNKRSVLKDSNENLPYTEFEATDMTPRRDREEPLIRTAVENRARQEYVVASPVPEPVQQSRKNSKSKPEKTEKKSKAIGKSKAKEKKDRPPVFSDDDDIIRNRNVDDLVSDYSDDETEPPRYHGYDKHGMEADIDKIVVLKSAYDRGQVEERFMYENGVRDYYSTYASTSAKMPLVADRVETYTKRGVQEFFGTLQIIVDFVVIFIVELARFLFRQFGRKLLGGVITVFGDSFLKPLLAATFNNIIQPMFVLVWNVMHIIRKLVEPALILTREIFSQFAMMLRALRLVDWNPNSKEDAVVKNV